tara:strand:- start:2047 stop:2337 length:291 start_codon:yes stop_codon:yes gene_type:complete
MKSRIAAIVVLSVVALVIFLFASAGHKSHIQSWAEKQDARVISIEKPLIRKGPFWIREDHHTIYKVKINDRLEHDREVWFRFGSLFGPDIEYHDSK